MSIFGHIEDASLSSMLQWGAIERMSGVISVSSPSGMGRIFLRDGELVYAEVQSRRLRTELVARELVSPEFFFRDRESSSDKSLIEAVIAHGVERDVLVQLLREMALEAAQVMLSWRSGTFSIDTHRHLEDPAGVFQRGRTVQAVLVDFARRSDEVESSSPALREV